MIKEVGTVSVIIKGFEIPRHCIDCPCTVSQDNSDYNYVIIGDDESEDNE